MKISELINTYGEKHNPYQGNLVNHLPMGQLAMYKISDSIEKTKEYTEKYVSSRDINKVSEFYDEVDSLEETLGNRNQYESALAILEKDMNHENADYYIKKVLNEYPLGMSSGLFHVLIRLAYAVEGYEVDKDYLSEIKRAVAYYITAYREAGIFSRKVDSESILNEGEKLYSKEYVKEILSNKSSLGQKMKALYDSNDYMKDGFIVQGDSDEKIKGALDISLNAYLNTESIVALHCITGTHALIVLKKYFEDFNKAVDVLNTCIITHLVASEIGEYHLSNQEYTPLTWKEIHKTAEEVTDVHAVKLAYTAYQLNKIYEDKRFPTSAAVRLNLSK